MGACCAPKVGPAKLTAAIQSTVIVKPAPWSATGEERVVRLGVLDSVTAPFMIINLPFVYAHTLDDARLAASLAATLQQFPLFAGRARTSKAASDFEVVLNGGGASFTVATSPCTLSDLLPAAVTRCGCCCAGAEGGADGGDNAGCMFRQVDLSPLYPPGPRMLFGSINKDVPLLHAQVTHLAGGGSCLAVAAPHLLGDLDTCKTVLTAWAAAYSAGAAAAARPPVLSPLGDRLLAAYAAPTLPPGWESPIFERRAWTFLPKVLGGALWHIGGAGGVDSVSYHVPAARLAELKAQASAGAGAGAGAGDTWVSTNDALVARLWQVLGSLPPKRRSRARFYLSVNLRRRLAPPLPGDALGNCAWSVPLGDGTEDVGGGGGGPSELAALAAAVRASIRGLDLAALSRELTWLEAQRGGGGGAVPTVVRGVLSMLPPGGNLVLSNWSWDAGYASVAFAGPGGPAAGAEGGGDCGGGGGCPRVAGAPVWHQPFQTTGPNSVFILPAPPALPGGGALVTVNLHRPLAAALRRACTAL